MRHRGWFSKIVAASAVVSMATPSIALAAQPVGMSPMVAVSALASAPSRAALCATAATVVTEAATSAALQPAPAQGCVLPAPDAAVTPPVTETVPASFSPLLAGLGALGLGVLLFALLHDDEKQAPPTPISPA